MSAFVVTSLAGRFRYTYVADPSGGLALIDSGIPGVSKVPLSVYVASDNSSRVTCWPAVVQPGETVQCTAYGVEHYNVVYYSHYVYFT